MEILSREETSKVYPDYRMINVVLLLVAINYSFSLSQTKFNNGRDSSLQISPNVIQVITFPCYVKEYRLILTREGIDHSYNRLFYQQLFLDTNAVFETSPLTEILLDSEYKELTISDIKVDCIADEPKIEFHTQDFWNEEELKTFILKLNEEKYILSSFNDFNKYDNDNKNNVILIT